MVLEDRFASATLEDRSLTLTRRTSRHSVPIFKRSDLQAALLRSSNEVIFKGSARSSNEVIFKALRADLQTK